MKPSTLLWSTLVILFACSVEIRAEADLRFEKDVRPILKAYCFECHGEGEKLKGKLDLRLRRFILRGGKSGASIAVGKPHESLLYERITKGEMPVGKKKLTKEQIDLISQWIAAGAKTARPEPEMIGRGFQFTDEERTFWAFQPVRRPTIPARSVNQAGNARTPIDSFLLVRLKEKGLSFSPEADRLTLLRRATYDLTGLPPSPQEVTEFLADSAPDAYERLIDRLLASPHYGERWGRHWLDAAGYADSEGYTTADPVRPHAYKYRDYVMRAFHADMPFDVFIQQQLAGDEMVRPPYRNLAAEDIDKLTATGFLRMAPDGTGTSGVDDVALARNQVIADTIKIVSTSLLGLSVGCAQCHNHRYDPIPQIDYYRLRAIFEPAYDTSHWFPPQQRRISLYTDADRKAVEQIEREASAVDAVYAKKREETIQRIFAKQLQKLPDNLRETARIANRTPVAKRTPEQSKLFKDYPFLNVGGAIDLYDPKAAKELSKFAQQAAAIRAKKPVEDFVRVLTEVPGRVPTTHLLYRGDHNQPRQAVSAAELTILDPSSSCRIPDKEPKLPSTGRRLAYAKWLTNGKHPLVARVLVNRAWLGHFGRGIVGTPGDFGTLGERPTHPEVLDWLASDFMAGGWRLKRLHKLIMTSTAYRQTSRRDPLREKIDPDNRLYWRMPVRRLQAEEIRDSILAVSGNLNRKLFGPPVPVRENEVGQIVIGVDNKDVDGRPGPEVSLKGEEYRRSVYIQVRRTKPLGELETFDAPLMDPNCPVRNASTVASQALMFMNSQFAVKQADVFAQRLRREAGHDPRAQVTHAWRLAFGSLPGDVELHEGLQFLALQQARIRTGPLRNGEKTRPDPERRALATFCQALISTNAFLYVD